MIYSWLIINHSSTYYLYLYSYIYKMVFILSCYFIVTDTVRHIDAVLGDKAEIPCNIQTINNSTEVPVLIIWYRGQDYPIYR